MSAKQEGKRAYRGKKRKSENPYPPGTPEHYQWDEGWDEARNEDLERSKDVGREPGM